MQGHLKRVLIAIIIGIRKVTCSPAKIITAWVKPPIGRPGKAIIAAEVGCPIGSWKGVPVIKANQLPIKLTRMRKAYAIQKLEHFDLVICGHGTIDSGTGQVAMQLAEFLDLPCVTDVEELTFEDEESLLVKRRWERGYIKARLKLPAVIAVTDKINQPRLANILGIMAVSQKEIKTWTATDVGANAGRVGLSGSPTQFSEMSEFHAEREGEILQGSPEEMVTSAVDKLLKLEML